MNNAADVDIDYILDECTELYYEENRKLNARGLLCYFAKTGKNRLINVKT